MLEDSSLEVINLMSYYNGLNKKKNYHRLIEHKSYVVF